MDQYTHRADVTRRDFLKGTAYATVGWAMGLNPASAQAVNPVTKVVVVRSRRVLSDSGQVSAPLLGRMLDTALEELSGETGVEASWGRYVRSQDVVGLKINVMVMPTHSELIEAITTRLALTGIPRERVIAWDRNHTTAERCSALINVAGLKTHVLSGIGGAIKNYTGAIPNPRDYHADDCASLGAIWSYPPLQGKTRLVIIDALQGLYHGAQVEPQYVWNYRGLIVGTDPVAVDAVLVKIIQEKRNRERPPQWLISPPPKHVAIADTRYGLGTSDLNKVELVGLEV